MDNGDFRSVYETLGKVYSPFARIFERSSHRKLIDYLDLKEEDSFIDLGCGTGDCVKMVAELPRPPKRICGLDYSSTMCKITRNKFNRNGLIRKVEVAQGDMTELPYEKGEFNVFCSSFALEVLSPKGRERAFEEIRRVAGDSGRIGILSLTNTQPRGFMGGAYDLFHEHFKRFVLSKGPYSVQREIENSGFEIQYAERISLGGVPTELVIATTGTKKIFQKVLRPSLLEK